VKNNRQIDVAKLVSTLKSKFNEAIDGGYGKIKGETFRISSMGDESTENIQSLLEHLDVCLKEIGA